MDEYPIIITAKERNGTIYIIENVMSENAKETAYDKVKRLILQAASVEKEKTPA